MQKFAAQRHLTEGDRAIKEARSVLVDSSKLLSERILAAKNLRASAGEHTK